MKKYLLLTNPKAMREFKALEKKSWESYQEGKRIHQQIKWTILRNEYNYWAIREAVNYLNDFDRRNYFENKKQLEIEARKNPKNRSINQLILNRERWYWELVEFRRQAKGIVIKFI